MFTNSVSKKLHFLTDDSQYSLFTTRDILRLVIPLFFEQLLFRLVGSADTLMVAGLGEASISAVSLIDMFNNCAGSIIIALATGGAVVAAQYIGAKSLLRARESAKQLLAILFVAGSAVLAAGELFPEQIIRLFYGKLPEDVHTAAVKYFKITLLTLPCVAVYGGCTALFRVMNRTKVTMHIAIISNIVNVAGNALLIYLFKLGVAGAAYATLVARLLSTAIILFMLADKSKLIFIDFRSGFRISWQFIKKILFIGIPGGIENGVFQFGRILVLGLIASYGTREIAANAVANTVDIFGNACGGVFTLAVVTVIGQAVGAGDEKQIRYYVKKMMSWAYITHGLWSLLVLACTPLILLCFSKLDEGTRQLAWYLILIHTGIGILMWPGSFVFPCILRSMNDVRVTMLISVGSMFAIRVGSSYFIAGLIGSGVLAVWIAMVLDWMVRITGFCLRYRSGAWTRLAHVKPRPQE